MTANTKMLLVLGALASFSLATWGLHEILAGALDPILKALGS